MRLERNADVIPMECYAPLLVNVNPGAAQWPTNLIGYDALRSFGSPSYHAQAMLGQNKGDVVIPAALNVAQQDAKATAAFATATYETASHTLIMKVVNIGQDPLDLGINLRGVGSVQPNATAWVLSGGDPKAQNTVEEPTRISPKQETLSDVSPSFRRTFPPYSFTVIRVGTSPQ
jgi:alpha-N-arabinofuranosidase